MGNTIKFGVHRNPLPDKEGKETYHVRHETDFALNLDYIVEQVRLYNEAEASHLKAAVALLRKHIVETLTDNHNVHVDGLGNFYLKLGFRKRTDENGQEVKPHFTDPAKITGNDVVVETINIAPDEEFLKELFKREYHYVNATGHGKVGHSADVGKEQVIARLDKYFLNHDHIIRGEMEALFGITRYMAEKWLNELCSQAPPYLKVGKIANALVYYRV